MCPCEVQVERQAFGRLLGKSPFCRLENAVARLGDLCGWSHRQGMIAGSFVLLVSVTHGVNVEGAFR